jgi:hypothetical protein
MGTLARRRSRPGMASDWRRLAAPAASDDECMGHALAHLRLARDYLHELQCPKAVARVRKALTSAYGAERNLSGRARRHALRIR